MLSNRTLLAGLVVGLVAFGASPGASAQQPAGLPSRPLTNTGWSFNVAPYLWLPSINTDLNYNLPAGLGGRLPTEVSAGPGEVPAEFFVSRRCSQRTRNTNASPC